MNEVPLITVIVPSYNSPDIFLSLQSVLFQDYPRIQLIVVDDGSVSFPKEAVEGYLQQNNRGNLENIQVHVNPENRGTVYSLNFALKQCCGAYIFNLAGDDCFYDSSVLSDWVLAFVETGAQVMTAYRAIYDEELSRFFRLEPTQEQVNRMKTMTPKALFEDLAVANYIFGCCTARTAECVRRYGLFDEGYRLIEDHPMNLKLLRQGEAIVFFDRIVVKYRGGGTSSPARYSDVYMRDVDRVLKQDVLPYTKHPFRMRWANYQWKRDQRLLQQRAQALQRYGSSKFLRLLIQLRYYLHHPWRTLCKLPAFLKKRQKEIL